MTAHDNLLASLVAERFTPLPESVRDVALEDFRLGALRRAELDGDVCGDSRCHARAKDNGWCLAHYPDEVAIQRAMTGERMTLLPSEREQVIRRLDAQGLTSVQISVRAHMNRASIVRVLAS